MIVKWNGNLQESTKYKTSQYDTPYVLENILKPYFKEAFFHMPGSNAPFTFNSYCNSSRQPNKYGTILEIPTTDLEEIATTMDIVRYGIKKQTVYKGFFLTESAAQSHLSLNRHHYGEKAHTYVEYAFRNPELEKLLKSIGEITGIPYAKK